MSTLLSWDTQLLLFINGHNTPAMDEIMWNSSQPLTWIPLYFFMLLMLFWCYKEEPGKKKRDNWLPVLLVAALITAGIGLSDYTTSGILKKWICRPRPTHEPSLESLLHIVNGYKGGQFGFPSSHAANTCCLMVQMACLMFGKYQIATRRASIPARTTFRICRGIMMACTVVYVIANCYSRMYLGVHYPSDILCGALIGSLLGGLTYLAATPIMRKVQEA